MTSTNVKRVKEQIERVGGVEAISGRKAMRPLTASEISQVKGIYGGDAELPPLFEAFAKTFGACSFRKHVAHGTGQQALFLGVFLGGGDDELNTVLYHVEAYRQAERMLPTLLPIATDGGGNLICIGVMGPEFGKVYFWDHNNEPPCPEEYEEDYGEPMPRKAWFVNLTLLADSFGDFLEQLTVFPDEVQ